MADERHQVVTKVWIEPGCIVCDACENDCPEVFDVREESCLVRPEAGKAEFLGPLTPRIRIAAEGCPVDVIKLELREMAGTAPWNGDGGGAAVPAAGAASSGGASPASESAPPRARLDAPPPARPDPRHQALIATAALSPSPSAGIKTTVRASAEVIQAQRGLCACGVPADAPPDQRAAVLAAAGAYAPASSLEERLRAAAAAGPRPTRRRFPLALAVAWSSVAACGAMALAMFQDFMAPKALKEPKKVWKVGRKDELVGPTDPVSEKHRRTPAGGPGFFLVHLAEQGRLVALSTVCTHLGCVPTWQASDRKFKCPCHGSGFRADGVNFEGPAPRPLERFRIYVDPSDGQVVVDQTVTFRQELGQWDDPDSYVAV